MNKILIVEDEKAIANLLRMNLTRAGYECMVAYDGNDGADMMSEHSFDLCILDIMLPGIDGYELLEYAKSIELPVIFLTAKDETEDKVRGLRQGADDYMTKPFETLELVARMEKILQRYHKAQLDIHVWDLDIDIPSRTVRKNGELLELTYKEFELLLLFVRNPNVALYRENIYEQVWNSSYLGDCRTVDLHVQRLRKKTGLEQEIEAVYKVGYRFCIEDKV